MKVAVAVFPSVIVRAEGVKTKSFIVAARHGFVRVTSNVTSGTTPDPDRERVDYPYPDPTVIVVVIVTVSVPALAPD